MGSTVTEVILKISGVAGVVSTNYAAGGLTAGAKTT
jgi:hypothetical protein